jgi:hypothetical protein
VLKLGLPVGLARPLASPILTSKIGLIEKKVGTKIARIFFGIQLLKK